MVVSITPRARSSAPSSPVVQPRIGETHLRRRSRLARFSLRILRPPQSGKAKTVASRKKLQAATLFGQEKKSLPYAIGLMNMILHGVEAPNILHVNTLEQNLNDIQERDRHDVIVANPPFGGRERAEVQQNFPIKTSETAFLFLQHFIRKLRAGGRGGIVIKNTFLSNTDNASVSLRRLLLESCTLDHRSRLPQRRLSRLRRQDGCPLLRQRRAHAQSLVLSAQPLPQPGQDQPPQRRRSRRFCEADKTFADSPQSWSVNVSTIDKSTFDLSVENPNGNEETVHRSPEEILDEIAALDAESAEILQGIRRLL